ncbi:MAG: DUF6262 family protein [Candidatus Nanopelagicales bacterium]
MRADNSGHIVAAARRRSRRTRDRATVALRRMDTAGQVVTFDSLAREAGVSRSWLCAQDDLRAEVERLRDRRAPRSQPTQVPRRQQASEDSLLRRLEAATNRIRRLEQDTQQLRSALALALGERRTADITGPAEARDTPKRQVDKR